MHFCNNCDNMYYIRISSDDENQLIYYCRNCGNIDNNISKENICVSKTQYKKNEQKYNHIINKYTKLDPTLPRTNMIKCPNFNCISNTEESSNKEVIYLRYDDINLSYIYLCSECDTVWNTDKNK